MAFQYSCRGCNAPPSPAPWAAGRCPHCGGYWDCVRRGGAEKNTESTLAALADQETAYQKTGIRGFDHVIGGGLVAGSVILMGGDRGAGKSSLLVSVAHGIASERRRVIFASAEQRAEDVGQIARRLGALNEHVTVLGNACDADEILERAEELEPALIIFDSLQTMTCSDVGGSEGSTAQGVAVANLITGFCGRTNTAGIIINHLVRSGEFAGAMAVEHVVATILRLEIVRDENGRETAGRVLSVSKNRNGASGLEAHFEMTDKGLVSSSRLSLVRG